MYLYELPLSIVLVSTVFVSTKSNILEFNCIVSEWPIFVLAIWIGVQYMYLYNKILYQLCLCELYLYQLHLLQSIVSVSIYLQVYSVLCWQIFRKRCAIISQRVTIITNYQTFWIIALHQPLPRPSCLTTSRSSSARSTASMLKTSFWPCWNLVRLVSEW